LDKCFFGALWGKRLFLLFNIAVFGGREIEKSLLEQGFFYGVYAGGAEYVLFSYKTPFIFFPRS